MDFLQQHTLKITTLSPVHIGSNETYEPTNYVIDNDALYEFYPQQALDALDTTQRVELLSLVSGRPDGNMLKGVQAFFYKHRGSLMAMSSHFLPVGDGVSSLYQERIGKTAQHVSGGRQVINKLEIERTTYNPQDNHPVFPGSSIKGAIRTALLDTINQGKSLQRGEKNRDLQQRLFQYTMRDLHKDPMRMVSISDAHWTSGDDLPGTEIRFAVNRRKKITEKEGRLIQSMAEKQGLYQLLECVPALRYRFLNTTLNLHKLDAARNHSDKLPAKALRWPVTEIATACNNFYQPLFNKELDLIESLGYGDPEWMQQVYEIASEALKGDAFLLRLGRHSGAEAVTLNGVRNIRIMKPKGEQPEWTDSPKTIWLAAPDSDSQTGMTPFGWVLVEIDTDHDLPCRNILDAATESTRQWQLTQRKKQQEHQQRLQTDLEQRRQGEKETAEEQARKQKEAEEKAAQLAAMLPIEREIEEFLQKFPGDNSAPELFNQLQSGKWESTADQRIVAEKIHELWEADNKWIPEFDGTNKQKCKQRERCIKLQDYL